VKLPQLATTGGTLYLWDSESLHQWDNMDGEHRQEWLIFMDWFREKPTRHTEEILQAIMAGLCPRKTRHRVSLRADGLGVEGYQNQDWTYGYSWLFRIVKKIGPDGVIEFPGIEPHYLHEPLEILMSREQRLSRMGRYYFRRRAWRPVYAFGCMTHAWSFLLAQVTEG
jgi:hypothetical protein